MSKEASKQVGRGQSPEGEENNNTETIKEFQSGTNVTAESPDDDDGGDDDGGPVTLRL